MVHFYYLDFILHVFVVFSNFDGLFLLESIFFTKYEEIGGKTVKSNFPEKKH